MSESANQKLKGNAVIGQSGGPTAVINQSLVGVIETLRGKAGIGKVLGCVNGVRGIVEGRFVELDDIADDRLERVARTPAAALGSTRDKPDTAYCHRIFEQFEARGIRYFFYIGGNDSSDACRIVNELARHAGYELRRFHVPKTIDNDLPHNDHTPGYGSAARFVAQAAMGEDLDNRALGGVQILITMGRHVGFLAAASVLARRRETDGPHLIYVPEVPFELDAVLGDIERTCGRLGRCVIVVSEGIHDADGTPMAVRLASEVEVDAHGNVQLSGTSALGDHLVEAIKNQLGGALRVRADTFGYMQRSFAGCVSETDAREAREVGREAARLALSGDIDGSVAIERVSDEPYTVQYKRIALEDVAGKTRRMDPAHILNGNDIAPSFRQYVAPLVGPLPEAESIVD